MKLKILKIDLNYRKCDHCLRKGEEHWMHGMGAKAWSISGDYCKKHSYIWENKVKEATGE